MGTAAVEAWRKPPEEGGLGPDHELTLLATRHPGLEELFKYPFMSALTDKRILGIRNGAEVIVPPDANARDRLSVPVDKLNAQGKGPLVLALRSRVPLTISPDRTRATGTRLKSNNPIRSIKSSVMPYS